MKKKKKPTLYPLPCPFCGEVPWLKQGEKVTQLVCPEGSICRGSGHAFAIFNDRLAEGMQVWNTRAELPSKEKTKQGEEI